MKCHECGKGTIKNLIIKNYKARLGGVDFPVKDAKVGRCDNCNAEILYAKELKRWEKLLKEYIVSSRLDS